MQSFLNRVAKNRTVPAVSADSWDSLWQWSVQDRGAFWEELRAFADVEFSAAASAATAGSGMLGTEWFPDSRLSYPRHLLRWRGSQAAIVFESERGERRELSRDELRQQVARCAAALRRDGVEAGDRVAGYMPNVPETVVAMLAATSIGAIWSSCSPDFGVNAVVDRFGQITPKVLFVPDGYSYNGKPFPADERVREIVPQLSGLLRVVEVAYLDPQQQAPGHRDIAGVACVGWEDYLGDCDAELTFTEVPFGHPLYVLYSSGTTGVPKCIVHGHGGTLLQHMKELMLHCDLRAEERIFYFTTCGWMMWNWLVSALGVGATVLLFDGNPAYPSISHLWEFAARERAAVFGTSPKFIAACQNNDLHPADQHDLAALRCVLSTGAPLVEEQFRWIYAEVGAELQLSSISGGTDIVSCFALGNPLLPVRVGELQCRGLGMDVAAWSEAGESLVGEKGELVCCSPFPSQPVGFWNDPDGSRYEAAYFEEHDGVWHHGDFVEITDDGGVVIYGRSDATLNPGGVRIGTAEIYRIVEDQPEIADSIVVGHNTDDDVEICLFVVVQDGVELDDALRKKLRGAIAERATRRHMPSHIVAVPAIPYTISGKKVELAVQQVLNGETPKNREALVNPEALDHFHL